MITNDIIQIGGLAQGVFTNEAARDAAITSPTEGMIVYLTAPTVPAATGANTSIPTGVKTIYNGSVWACVTEVGANTDTSGTTASASYTTTLAGGGTNPTVTLVTGTTALVGFAVQASSSVTSNQHLFVSISVSGASTIAASDSNGGLTMRPDVATFVTNISRTFIFTGLTAGTNTFALNYGSVTFGTNTYINRRLWVKGIA